MLLCKYQGLGIPSLYISQGISHIKALINAPPAEGIVGSLLKCSAEGLKLKIGLPGNFLQHEYKWLQPAVTEC